MTTLAVQVRIDRNDSIVFVFPTEAGSDDPDTMTVFCYREGHSTAHMDWVRQKTIPAPDYRAQRAFKELQAGVYADTPLRLVKRAPPNARKMRIAQITA